MEGKHTPGPLYCGTPQRLQGAIMILQDPPDKTPRRPAIGAAWDDVGSDEEWEANARLWAAAPDLLEALEELTGILSNSTADNMARLKVAHEKGLTAIAKARGISSTNPHPKEG